MKLGVALLGEGGGEWIVHLDDGAMRVAAGLAADLQAATGKRTSRCKKQKSLYSRRYYGL